MATHNIKLRLKELEFPNFEGANQRSKENFRLLFIFRCVDDEGKPGTIGAALPPWDKNNWQWRDSKKSNYLENDGKGTIFVDTIHGDDRIILWQKINIHSISLKVVDVADKHFLDYAKPVLKNLAEFSGGLVSGGLSGIFLSLFDTVNPTAQKEFGQLMDKLTSGGNKVLFQDYVEENEAVFFDKGEIHFSGDGVLGKYSVKVELSFVDLDEKK